MSPRPTGSRQRRRFRLRHRRLWADLRRRERDGKLIAEEAYEQEREAAEIDAELRLTGASGLYDVSRLPRDPPPRRASATSSPSSSPRWRATLRATPTRASTAAGSSSSTRGSRRCRSATTGSARRGGSRSATSPTACRCSRPARRARGGVPLGYATPGQHARARRPLRPRATARTSRWSPARRGRARRSRSTRCSRATSRAARRGYIIDRSSSEDEGGSTRHAGHYEQLAALIPGARVIHFGAGDRDAILNPWDVPDPAQRPGGEGRVPARAAHAADRRPQRRRARRSAGWSARCSPAAIQAVYARCAAHRRAAARAAAARGAAPPRARAGRRRARRRRQRRVRAAAPRRAAAPLRRRRPGRVAGRPRRPRSRPARRWCSSISPGCRTRWRRR